MKEIQINSCQNPKCQKEFENLIIVHDNSKMPIDNYYACPYCLVKLDSIATQETKEDKIFAEDNTEIKENPTENYVSPGCPHYLGYLLVHYNDAIISKECLSCPKLSECTLEKSHKKSN